MQKFATTEYSVPVSAEEKARAEELRASLENFVAECNDFRDFFDIWADSLEQVGSADDLLKISDVVVRYMYKMRQKFNGVIIKLSEAIEQSLKMYSETRTNQIKSMVLGAMSEARICIVAILRLSNDIDAKDYLEDVRKQTEDATKYIEQAVNAVHDEWIAHLDKNVLGRARLL